MSCIHVYIYLLYIFIIREWYMFISEIPPEICRDFPFLSLLSYMVSVARAQPQFKYILSGEFSCK